MKATGSVARGGPLTGDSVPVPTAPTAHRDGLATPGDQSRVRSPIGPSSRTPEELAALERRIARKYRSHTHAPAKDTP